MGRPQTFERDQVVRAARGVFWERGFEGASVPDLESATGLSRSSIYNAFGSKRGLFDAAVESYLDEVVRPRLAALGAADVAPGALLGYLDSLRAAFTSPAVRRAGGAVREGCLLLNSAGAPLAHDEEFARTVTGYRRELRDAMGRGVRAARPDLDPSGRDVLAESLTALLVESLLLVRVSPEEAVRILDTAREMAAAGRGPAGSPPGTAREGTDNSDSASSI